MPPLIVFVVGIIAMILFMTVSASLAMVIVVILVFTCLFRIRHLGRSHPRRDGTPQSDSIWPFLWLNSNDSDGTLRPELYVADKLHFNAEGYQLLAATVRAAWPKDITP